MKFRIDQHPNIGLDRITGGLLRGGRGEVGGFGGVEGGQVIGQSNFQRGQGRDVRRSKVNGGEVGGGNGSKLRDLTLESVVISGNRIVLHIRSVLLSPMYGLRVMRDGKRIFASSEKTLIGIPKSFLNAKTPRIPLLFPSLNLIAAGRAAGD